MAKDDAEGRAIAEAALGRASKVHDGKLGREAKAKADAIIKAAAEAAPGRASEVQDGKLGRQARAKRTGRKGPRAKSRARREAMSGNNRERK
jgi:hypothetical protein